ncbi:zinc ABC transporter substrate-binding protein [Gordonia sp. LSe1-13]|uniref:Zinc ABC transporter substrate-binding protein n=1 Tax=Gordonia sesuvii TaxID=3116777 RepID=A0ABU7MJF6_9ACTN|nr:zinc ABC transporter substrate-binding protein [Gordonia sp. LSe1-13]
MRRALTTTVAMIGAGALALSGCSDDNGTDASGAAPGTPTVVTSTNVWASVASAVGGENATVTAMFTDPSADPHEFEPSAADTAEVADADLVVLNGGHYDQYLEDAVADTGVPAVNAFELFEAHASDGEAQESDSAESGDDHAGHDHGDHDHADHDHSAMNEHVFYDLEVVGEVATQVGDQLAEIAPDHADTYRANAEAFNAEIDGLQENLAQIRTAHDGTEVAQTEPLADYLLAEAGLVDAAPAGFTQAVEEGQSPSAADRAALEDLLTGHEVHSLIYNTQAVDSVTEAVLATAQGANVPVVEFTETLPDGVDGYVAWQTAQIDALRTALDSDTAH